MKTILRTLAILAAAVLVTYGAIALLGSTGGPQEGGRGFGRQAPPAGDQANFQSGGFRGGGEGFGGGRGRGGGDFGERDGGDFGLATILRNLFLVSLVILVVTLIGKAWKALRGRLNRKPPALTPTPGA